MSGIAGRRHAALLLLRLITCEPGTFLGPSPFRLGPAQGYAGRGPSHPGVNRARRIPTIRLPKGKGSAVSRIRGSDEPCGPKGRRGQTEPNSRPTTNHRRDTQAFLGPRLDNVS